MILLFSGVDTGSYDGNFYSELDDLKINGLKLNETLNFTKFLKTQNTFIYFCGVRLWVQRSIVERETALFV